MSYAEKNNIKLLQVSLNQQELRVLIVGGGNESLENLKYVLGNNPAANVLLVAEVISAELIEFAKQSQNVELKVEAYRSAHLDNRSFVIAAVNDKNLAHSIRTEAHKKGLLVNIPGESTLCDIDFDHHRTKQYTTPLNSKTIYSSEAKHTKEKINETELDDNGEVLENLYQVKSNSVNAKRLSESLASTRSNSKPLKYRVARMAIYSLVVIMLMGLTFAFVFGDFTVVVEAIGDSFDNDFLLYVAGGILAQMIDGSLGMAYGVSVTTFLLSLGIPAITPAVASASMHASEIFTTGTASLVYMRHKNVNKKLFKKLLLPGIVGAVCGATLISFASKDSLAALKPLVSIYTLSMGIAIILKAMNFVFIKRKLKAIAPIAAAGGFLDSVGGGGWGPIVTTTLVAGGRNLRYAVGSSHLAKFFVALVSTVTFFSILGWGHWKIIIGLTLGGMLAAPFSIYLSNKIPVKKGLILVGVVVILISLRNLIVELF